MACILFLSLFFGNFQRAMFHSHHRRILIISLLLLLAMSQDLFTKKTIIKESKLSKNKITENVSYLSTTAKKGDGIIHLLKRYNLDTDQDVFDEFITLNKQNLGKNNSLLAGSEYRLPLLIFKKGTKKRIASDNDFDVKELELYNRKLEAKEIKEEFKTIWVPTSWLNDENIDVYFRTQSAKVDLVEESKPKKRGKKEDTFIEDEREIATKKKKEKKEEVEVETEEKETKKNKNIVDKELEQLLGKVTIKKSDNKLKGCVFYLDAGHGGPDPGAIGNREGKDMCEDEYAYDITLRLAKRLYESGAKVFMIVQDKGDGIRDDKYLNNTSDEYYIGEVVIDRNQKARLNKRSDLINELYNKNKKKFKKHYAVTIHIDSRTEGQRVDIFFYYKEGNEEGKELAEKLMDKIEKKYEKAQPGRGYKGSVTSRNLLMLRKNQPTSVYLELGNIQNTKDQLRFVDYSNRQAIANWLHEGFVEFIKNK